MHPRTCLALLLLAATTHAQDTPCVFPPRDGGPTPKLPAQDAALARRPRPATLPMSSLGGSAPNLVLLVRFSDHGPGGQDRTLPSALDVDTILDAPGGDPSLAPHGSVHDYYLENSGGAFAFESTVVGWLDLPQTEAYYSGGLFGFPGNVSELVTQALELADPFVDFADFDSNGDGWVDALTVLHSGYGAEWGGVDVYGTPAFDRIWSHKWSLLSTWTSDEAVQASTYNISPGLWSTSGSEPCRIGVIAHELGHVLGLPDTYDTDGGGLGDGHWCLMGAGSWGFDGEQQRPSHLSAWCKLMLGWAEAQEVLHDGSVLELSPIETSQQVGVIQSGYPVGEFLLLEHREGSGFNQLQPQDGLLVWHVDHAQSSLSFNQANADEGHPGQSDWPSNGKHYRIALLQADGAYDLEQGDNPGDAGDVFHFGMGGVSALDEASLPSTDAYQAGDPGANGNQIQILSASASGLEIDFSTPDTPEIFAQSLMPVPQGAPYAHTFGGSVVDAPARWAEHVLDPSYEYVVESSSLYVEGGVAQTWKSFDATWELELPFAFPYYESAYTRVHVSSNGFLDFADGHSEPWAGASYLRLRRCIAPLWDDLDTMLGDIYVDESVAGQVTIRWDARRSADASACRFAVVLFEDGRMRFDYGPGNASVIATCGLARGRDGELVLPDGYQGTVSLDGAPSLSFTRVGSQLPPGLTLSGDGVLSGVPTAVGNYAFVLQLFDGRHRIDEQWFELEILEADCNGNGLEDAAEILAGTALDLDQEGTLDVCQQLSTTQGALSLSEGGQQLLHLHAGPLHAGELYLVLGSASGTQSGLTVGEDLVLPLTPDAYTQLTLGAHPSAPLQGGLGWLDAEGEAWARFELPPGSAPQLAGLELHHAWVALGGQPAQVSLASNAMPLQLLP